MRIGGTAEPPEKISCKLMRSEAQAFWPSEMRPGDWKPFDLPGGIDASRIQGRPRDYADAWTRHRHFNWDIVLTTPDIKLFHSKIRSVSETAYLHKNQAIIGLRGRYLEGMHLASKNGNASDFFVVRGRKIPKWIFDLKARFFGLFIWLIPVNSGTERR